MQRYQCPIYNGLKPKSELNVEDNIVFLTQKVLISVNCCQCFLSCREPTNENKENHANMII